MKHLTGFLTRSIDYLRTKGYSDEFITWLRYANAGMLNKGNIYSMDHAIRNLDTEDPLLEIGSFCGLSTNVLTYLLTKHDKKNRLFTCDNWDVTGVKNYGNIGCSDINFTDYSRHVKETFIRNVEFFSGERKPNTIEIDSDGFFDLWSKNETVEDVFSRKITLGGPVSFCYIDGVHSYETVKREFLNLEKHLITGGYILFDDSSDDNPYGLTRLMREIKRNASYELVMKNPNYLFKKTT